MRPRASALVAAVMVVVGAVLLTACDPVVAIQVTTTIDGSTVVLPRTGSDPGRLAILGVTLLGIGLTLLALARRPRRASN